VTGTCLYNFFAVSLYCENSAGPFKNTFHSSTFQLPVLFAFSFSFFVPFYLNLAPGPFKNTFQAFSLFSAFFDMVSYPHSAHQHSHCCFAGTAFSCCDYCFSVSLYCDNAGSAFSLLFSCFPLLFHHLSSSVRFLPFNFSCKLSPISTILVSKHYCYDFWCL